MYHAYIKNCTPPAVTLPLAYLRLPRGPAVKLRKNIN